MVARREGFEPPSGRSVVSHHPSPPVLPIPSRPRWSWPTAMSPTGVGHLSPSVTRGLVALWSQFRAVVARPGVWRLVALARELIAGAPDSGSGALTCHSGLDQVSPWAHQDTIGCS